MFETQKYVNKTSSGETGLDIRTHASPKVGQDHVSGVVSVLCWHAAPVANVQWKLRTIQERGTSYCLVIKIPIPTIELLELFLVCCGCDTSYIVSVHIQFQLRIYTFVVLRAFMAGAASQAGDADSSRALVLTSGLKGSVNVHRGALLLVPQWQCISSFVLYIFVTLVPFAAWSW